MKFEKKYKFFYSAILTWKCYLSNVSHFDNNNNNNDNFNNNDSDNDDDGDNNGDDDGEDDNNIYFETKM